MYLYSMRLVQEPHEAFFITFHKQITKKHNQLNHCWKENVLEDTDEVIQL